MPVVGLRLLVNDSSPMLLHARDGAHVAIVLSTFERTALSASRLVNLTPPSDRINRLIDCCGLVLRYDDKPVRLRCCKAPGSKAGQIQARLTRGGSQSGPETFSPRCKPPPGSRPRIRRPVEQLYDKSSF